MRLPSDVDFGVVDISDRTCRGVIDRQRAQAGDRGDPGGDIAAGQAMDDRDVKPAFPLGQRLFFDGSQRAARNPDPEPADLLQARRNAAADLSRPRPAESRSCSGLSATAHSRGAGSTAKRSKIRQAAVSAATRPRGSSCGSSLRSALRVSIHSPASCSVKAGIGVFGLGVARSWMMGSAEIVVRECLVQVGQRAVCMDGSRIGAGRSAMPERPATRSRHT